MGSAISSSDRADPPKTRERPHGALTPRYANTRRWAGLVAAARRGPLRAVLRARSPTPTGSRRGAAGERERCRRDSKSTPSSVGSRRVSNTRACAPAIPAVRIRLDVACLASAHPMSRSPLCFTGQSMPRPLLPAKRSSLVPVEEMFANRYALRISKEPAQLEWNINSVHATATPADGKRYCEALEMAFRARPFALREVQARRA